MATPGQFSLAFNNDRLKAKLGEVMIERELLREKIAAMEAGRPHMRSLTSRAASLRAHFFTPRFGSMV
ncbi:hypothetical protein AA12717_3982 [Gluconacetobacter sacchari DSM 12717]|uniref:Transposase n=1 Tax=Gluconacetobacter sacchari DSM 12717 TaxID=1307940 RepID=A0ABQ0PD07_9PROT|nr:hypothetical protein AA12717_3982 [Gluconacetobacter sacchari DSM 12717]